MIIFDVYNFKKLFNWYTNFYCVFYSLIYFKLVFKVYIDTLWMCLIDTLSALKEI